MGGVRRTPASILIDAWVLVLATMLCLPALTSSGLGLSGDLVFSPRQPLTLETVGLGERLPRAVPLDAVVGLLGEVVPGAALFRMGVLGGLLLAGWGAHRLASGLSLPSRVAAASFAVWNPYVVERLALGQWALLLAYGALFFVALGALGWRGRNGERDRPLAPWSTWAWVGLASLTPTGGLWPPRSPSPCPLAVGRVSLWDAFCCSFPGCRRRPSAVVPGSVTPGESRPSVLSPTLREEYWSACWASAASGTSTACRPRAPRCSAWLRRSWWWSRFSERGGVCRSVSGRWSRWPSAACPCCRRMVPGLDDLLRWVVTRVPGGGLLRDSQKWLAPLAVLASLSLGVSLDRLRDWLLVRGWAMTAVVAVVGVSTPFLLLPDAASRTWDAVRPVTYPTDFSSVRDRLARRPTTGGWCCCRGVPTAGSTGGTGAARTTPPTHVRRPMVGSTSSSWDAARGRRRPRDRGSTPTAPAGAMPQRDWLHWESAGPCSTPTTRRRRTSGCPGWSGWPVEPQVQLYRVPGPVKTPERCRSRPGSGSSGSTCSRLLSGWAPASSRSDAGSLVLFDASSDEGPGAWSTCGFPHAW